MGPAPLEYGAAYAGASGSKVKTKPTRSRTAPHARWKGSRFTMSFVLVIFTNGKAIGQGARYGPD